eukprot:6468068-Amphidinium_carterae.1
MIRDVPAYLFLGVESLWVLTTPLLFQLRFTEALMQFKIKGITSGLQVYTHATRELPVLATDRPFSRNAFMGQTVHLGGKSTSPAKTQFLRIFRHLLM